MTDDLSSAAVEAFRSAAEGLGVEPHRLARFLGEGRLADLLEALGRPRVVGPRKILGLAESYLEFLEREIEIREGGRPERRRES